METEIRRQRAIFADQRALLPAVRGRIVSSGRDLAILDDCPANTVERSRIKRQLDRYGVVVKDILGKRYEKNFEAKVRPFLQANERLLFRTDKSKVPPTSRKRHHHAVSQGIESLAPAVPGTCRVKRRKKTTATVEVTKREMLEEYMTLFDGAVSVPDIEVDDVCPLCDLSLIVVDRKAQATCTRCGYSKFYIDSTTASMQYNTDMEFSSFSYKRVNHFNDWMAQVQARENNSAPDEVLEMVMAELVARRVSRTEEITIPLVRDVLKRLKLRKAYEHVTQIVCRLTGQPPPRLHPHLEECCRIMFIQIQPSFERHKGRRKNMLSYSYTLFKFLQLLGVEDIPMLHFSLLKSKQKLEKQDEIFAKIAHDLDWEFIPSI